MSGTLKIIDLNSNQEVYSESYDGTDLSAASLEFETDALKPDSSYKMYLEVSYKLSQAEDESVSAGTRTYINRSFSTTSYGVIESFNKATSDSIEVNIEKKDYSRVVNAELSIYSGDEKVHTAPLNGLDVGTIKHKFDGLKSNTEYKVRLVVTNPDAKDENEKNVQISESVYKTLKKAPLITKAPVVAVNPRGYFELRPDTSSITDEDHGIVGYRYDFYTPDGTFVTSVERDNGNTAAIYPDGTTIKRDVHYQIKLVLEFDDNEKIVEYESPFTKEVYISGETGVPYLVFNKEKLNYETIKGSMEIHLNGAELADIDSTKPLTLSIFNETIGQYPYQTWYSDPFVGSDTSVITVPVDLTGLKQNTTYRFSLYGYYQDSSSQQLLTSMIVTTPKAESISARFDDTLEDDEIKGALNAKLYFTRGSKAAMEGDRGQYEAHKVSNVCLRLLENGSMMAEAKIPYDILPPDKTGTAEFDSNFYNRVYTDDVDGTPSEYLLINNIDTFNINDNQISDSSNYTLEIIGLEDYTSIDEYRYKGTDSNPTNFVNTISVENNKIDLIKKQSPPELPENALDVEPVTKNVAMEMGIDITAYEELPGDAVVGFYLNPQYDNSGLFAQSYTMYVFEEKTYNSEIAKISVTEKDPLNKIKDHAIDQTGYTMYSNNSWGYTLPKQIVLMGKGNPGTVKSGRYEGTEYRYLNNLVRGHKYVFAYDVMLELEGKPFSYPYMHVDYTDTDKILKGISQAEKVKPEIYAYPSKVTSDKSVWMVKAKDIDKALPQSEAFKLNYDKGTKTEYADYDPSVSGYQEIVFNLDAEYAKQNYINEVVSFGYKYYVLDSSSREAQSNINHIINKKKPTFSVRRTQDADLEKDKNAVIYELTINNLKAAEVEDLISGVSVYFDAGKSGKKKTLYAPLLHKEGNTYIVMFDRNDLDIFMNEKFTAYFELWYLSDTYGYDTGLADGDLVALQSNDGRFYITDDMSHTLVPKELAWGSLFKHIKTVKRDDDKILVTLKDMIKDASQQTYSFSINGTGAGLGVGINLMKLETTNYVEKLENETLGYIIPSVEEPMFTPSINQTEFNFRLPSTIADLIEGGMDGKIRFEVSGDNTVRSYEFSLKDIAKKDGKYNLTLGLNAEGLGELSKNTQYTVRVYSVLKGDTKETQFRDANGKPGEFIFKTLPEVKFNVLKSQIINEYHGYKMLDVEFGLDSITGIQLRYDIYNMDNENEPELIYSYEDLLERKAEAGDEYKQFDDKQRFFEMPEAALSLTNNYMRYNLAPPASKDREWKIRPGHKYAVKLSAYPKGTDYSKAGYESSCAGEQWTELITYSYQVDPTALVTVLFDDSDYSKMTLTTALNDPENIIATDAFVKLNDDGTPVKDKSGKYRMVRIMLKNDGTPATDADGKYIAEDITDGVEKDLLGAYVFKLYEAEYAASDKEHNVPIKWRQVTVDDNILSPEQVELFRNNAIHGTQHIELQNLKKNTQYKLEIYAKKNTGLQYMPGIKPGNIYSGNTENVVLITEYIQRTVGDNGILIDKKDMKFIQQDKDTVVIRIYDAVGISKAKAIRCSFMPATESVQEYSRDTKYVELVEGQNMVTKNINGRRRTDITLKVNFGIEDDYTIGCQLYGENLNKPLLTLTNQDKKSISVTMIN
ncbi:MAG: hypothetical protein Q4B86_04865 [Eubacteriales bacterium]|nr:hypothetical protein [Eubacteriales bacterium]